MHGYSDIFHSNTPNSTICHNPLPAPAASHPPHPEPDPPTASFPLPRSSTVLPSTPEARSRRRARSPSRKSNGGSAIRRVQQRPATLSANANRCLHIESQTATLPHCHSATRPRAEGSRTSPLFLRSDCSLTPALPQNPPRFQPFGFSEFQIFLRERFGGIPRPVPAAWD